MIYVMNYTCFLGKAPGLRIDRPHGRFVCPGWYSGSSLRRTSGISFYSDRVSIFCIPFLHIFIQSRSGFFPVIGPPLLIFLGITTPGSYRLWIGQFPFSCSFNATRTANSDFRILVNICCVEPLDRYVSVTTAAMESTCSKISTNLFETMPIGSFRIRLAIFLH